MRYSNHTWIPLAAIGWLLSILAGCHYRLQQVSYEEHLLDRIEQYYHALQTKTYTKSILFHADRRTQTPAEKFDLASKLSLEMESYDIQSVHIDDLDARVVMHVNVKGYDRQYDIVVIDHWQFLEDNWFIIDVPRSTTDETGQALEKGVWQGGIKW